MHKWALVFSIFFLAVSFSVFAGGRKDNESREVANPSGFTESIDINDKAPGKWNIYLEAQDKGGNTTIAGPHNIYIDPESDLPVARIINPQSNMHVQGNLNIVGTCVDDDGVDHVELVITRGGDGKGEVMVQTRAEGAEFWSYFLDTSDTQKWRDGVYTVTAWGVDINGLSGISDQFPVKSRKQYQVSWNLDRKKPEIKVTSNELGALLSGKVTLKGTVWDGNGVDSLSYSIDNGARYNPISLKYDTKNDIYNYDLPLDTKTLEDGPAVIMFKARDKMKTEGALSFLIFVNNTGPDVQIMYPDPDEKVSGIFTVAGMAMHKVGLASLSWKLGKDSGEIPLIIGNPWWVKEFDIRGQDVKSLDLEIRAEDLSGNVTVVKRKILVDQELDLPKVTVNEPAAGAIIPDTGMNLVGVASDDDGVASIFYSLDGKTPVEVPCSGYFQLTVQDIPEGVHNLDVWAKDITDVVGRKVSIKGIVVPGAAPQPRITQVRSSLNKINSTAEFYSGIDINKDAVSTLDLLIRSGSGLQSFSYQFGSNAPVVVSVKGTKGGDYTQNIPVPKDIDLGLARLEIKAQDTYGRETVLEDYFSVVDSNGQRGYAADTLTWVRPDNSLGDGRILLPTNEALVGIYSGGPLQRVEPTGTGADSFQIQVDEQGRIELLGSVDGNYTLGFNLTAASGKQFTTPQYRFLVDSAEPTLNMVENPDGKWVQNKVGVKFQAADGNKIKSVDFSIDLGASWQRMLQPDEISQLTADSVIDRTLDISALADGAINVSLRVTDEANKQTIKTFSINKDTTAPEGRLIVPISGARVNGTIRLGIAVTEGGKLASIRYENPGSDVPGKESPPISRQLYPDPSSGDMPFTFLDVVLDTNVMPLSENMRFVFTDMAGNTSTLSNWPFIIDQDMDLPVVQISLPLENEVVTSDFVVSGICYDDDQVKSIHWRIDDGDERVVDARNGYSFEVPLSSMTDNEHSVTLYAEDIYGVKGKPETRNFRVSLEDPKASVAMPAMGEIVGGTVQLSGIAMDGNGIKKVQVSLDNGNSYNDAEGTTRWTYSFNSKILADGPTVVFIKAWDNYDMNALYSSMLIIDNTPPELVVDTPTDGTETTGPIYITGQAVDAVMLDSITIKLNSLEGVEIPPQLAEQHAKLDSVLLEEMDLSSLPDGTYNVEVWAIDKANNVSRVSRNISLNKDNQRNFVDNLYPLNGEHVQGNFNLYGQVGGIDKATQVTLVVNGIDVTTEDVTEAGYYCFAIGADNLRPGSNRITVRSDFSGKEMVQSPVRVIDYQPSGPWVTVDTMNMGDFAYERPWLMGRAGYELSDEDNAILADKKADKDVRAEVDAKKVSSIELSLDNGRTFFTAAKAREKGYDWRYRLETQEMTEGLHYLLVRASMANGEVAVTRLLIQIDKTPPVIRLISPEPGGHYNTNLEFSALASDDVELKSLTYYLRKGDKSSYEIPGFIKGMYIEGTIPPFIKYIWNGAPSIFGGGATFFDVGLGLSFFGDNVKIQAQYGLMTQSLYEGLGGKGQVRYGGHVLGFKILANVYTLPFGSFGGPDWDWLSASFALGANFSLFDVAHQGYTQSGESTWLSAVLAQIEFPKVTIPKRTFLRTFSLFTEGQLWFVPTDISASANKVKTIVPHMIIGVRAYIF